MDVKTAFLNGNLDEEIYMTIPEGVQGVPNSACKLNRTLYGLKQSPRMWNKKIDEFLHSRGFIRLDADHSIYTRRNGHLAIIALYVDDLILLTDSSETMSELKLELTQAFEMTDCGELHYFLGLRVQRDRARRILTLNQGHFVDQILMRFNMTDCHPVSTPLDPSVQLKRSDGGGYDDDNNNNKETNYADETLFRQIIGSLMFLMIGTRPDIAAAVSIISQFSTKPTQEHYQAAKRILRYLKGSANLKLYLGGISEADKTLKLIGYSDANWGNDTDTRKSTTGYLFYLSGGVVSWSSKRQATVALSSTEAEYMALTHTTKETIWLRTILKELGFAQNDATTLYEDNQSCIALAKNPIHHARTKHIDIQHHFVREKVESKEVELAYMSTDDMVADALTKPLARPKFAKLVAQMNLRD